LALKTKRTLVERQRTRSIQSFILDQVGDDPKGIARRVGQAYGISRQAANRHLDALVHAGVLQESGHTRARWYTLRRVSALMREFRVTPVLNPERVWGDHGAPLLAGDRAGVRETCHGAFLELVGNAIEHSGASWVSFELTTTAREIDLAVADDGVGAFVSLAAKLGAASPRDAAEELAQRARTQAIAPPVARLLLLARGAEKFSLRSSGLSLEFDATGGDWVVQEDERAQAGTAVAFRVRR
jgi:hypothetical protein